MSRIANRWEDLALLAVSAIGLAIFTAPLLLGAAIPRSTALFSGAVAGAAVVIVAIGLQTHRLSTRLLAVLAALVAIDATIRLVIVIGLLGFSPIFFLLIVAGAVMGPGFGFALGALTLLLSAVITAGLGPWLPYQMLGAGWVGMGAGYVGRVSTGGRGRWLLALYGSLAGFGYGMLLDLWEWPVYLAAGTSSVSWAPGLSPLALVSRFAAFYATTSLVYDAFRAAGNAILILALGQPVMMALERFRRRFLVQWVSPAGEPEAAANIAGDVRTPA